MSGYWVEAFRAGQRRGAYVVSDGMRVYTSPYGTERRMVNDAQATALESLDEGVLLGPVSAWVAEGEARAVRDWEAQRGQGPGSKWCAAHNCWEWDFRAHRDSHATTHDLLNRPRPTPDPDLPSPGRERLR